MRKYRNKAFRSKESALSPGESHSITLPPGRSEPHIKLPLFTRESKFENVKERFRHESTDANGRQGETLPAASDLTRFVGRYEFFSSSEPSFKEAVVEIVGGQLTISINGKTQTLMPITAESVPLVTEHNVFSFQIPGRPDTHIRFFMSGENVKGLYYEEKRENDLVLAIAAPKFSGPSS